MLLEQCAEAVERTADGFQLRYLLPLAALVLFLVTIIRNHLLLRRGLWIGRDHPLLREAAAKAQATLPVMRELHANGDGEVAVKFSLIAEGADDDAAGEQVWGQLLDVDASSFTATVDTDPVFAQRPVTGRLTLPLSCLLDWQCEVADGPVRGGFSTQAEIRICRQRRQRLPKHVAALQGRFADN